MAFRSGTRDLEAQGENQALTSTGKAQNYATMIRSLSMGSEGLSEGASSEYYEVSDEIDDDDEEQVDGDGNDIVQLSAPIYYTAEDGNSARVEIIRLGSHEGVVSVVFNTRAGTAHPGINFTATQKEIVFKTGQATKTIDIPILDDGMWTPSSEFSVHLEKPQGCRLGMSLFQARVKILNSDPFPSDEYQNVVHDDGLIDDLDMWGLYWSYLAFNFRCGGVGQQSILYICLDQLTNICMFVSLCIAVYMVDVLFDRGTQTRQHLMTKDRYHDAVLIGFWYLVPVVLLFLRDAYKARLDIKGTTEAFLRKCMMKSFLQYTEKSRAHILHSDLNIAICENARFVARGYIAGISIFQSIGKIFTVLLFMCLYQPHIQAIIMVVFMPILLLLFAAARLGPALRAEQGVGHTMRELVVLTQEARLKYRLIADYFKRYLMSDMFSHAADEHKNAVELQTFVQLVTAYVTKFITGFFICAYIILNAQAVLESQLSLGLFLATITIFATYLADAIMELNSNLGVIMESFLSLQQTTIQFNLPLEHYTLKSLSDLRRRKTLVERKRLRRGSLNSLSHKGGTDAVEIRLKNVSLEYAHPGENRLDLIFKNVSLAAPQGSMIAIVGGPSSHKRTFMKMLADTVLPTRGHVFLPSHLRVLHVSREPMFLSMSLFHNLTLGAPAHKEVDMERVSAILHQMDMPDVAEEITKEFLDSARLGSPREKLAAMHVSYLGSTGEKLASFSRHDTRWLSRFSHTRQAKLHISRALIADPNVMIMQRPLHHFSEAIGNDILKVLRMHVENRGLGYATEKSARRPRTLFLIPETKSQANAADVIWSMNPESKSVDVSYPSKGWLG